jgi:hypothetical protein
MKTAIIEKLRHLVGSKTERELIPFSLLPHGVPKGAITEISGKGKTEFVLQFLKENSELKVVWIERNFSAYPFGFLQREVDLDRFLFIEGAKDLDWCVYQALRTSVFQAVIVYSEDIGLNSLRRIQLQSEKSLAATLWLTDQPKNAWPVHLRIAIEREEGEVLRATILKQRS